jgi:HD-GYP domain-containing protein (c-di-GMP phosphodiesterase class II)
MHIYRRIDDTKDIKSVAFVVCNDEITPVSDIIINTLKPEYRMLSDNEVMQYLYDSPPDIFFIGSDTRTQNQKSFRLCHTIRESGYQGIIVLIADSLKHLGATTEVTSAGFDNYLLSSDSAERIKDIIHWAIINRKRKNKYIIQFDDNPDSFYITDRDGRIHEINKRAAMGSNLTPKEIVRNGINISRVGTLKSFKSIIRPLITEENIGKVFSRTVYERESIFQIKTKIHNVPTIGLVATVVKTDITRTIYARTLDILVNSITMLSQRDNYTAQHSSRVFYYCMHLADRLGYSRNKKFLRELYFAALLHDIGKIGIRDHILLKPGKLTKKEFHMLSTHPVKGYKILKRYEFLRDSVELVRSHHERPDGMGYPDKLRGNQIPLGASIIAVADSFDAMTTNRPYRGSLPYEKAVSEIKENLGTQYNKDVGAAFLSMLTPKLVEDIRNMSRKPLDIIAQELLETI